MMQVQRPLVRMTPFSQRTRSNGMVTFADMMALLLTFFIIMLAYSTVDSGKYDDVMSSLGQAFGTPVPVAEPVAEPVPELSVAGKPDIAEKSEIDTVIESMQANMASEITQGTLEIERQQGKVVIRFPEHAAFQTGRADIHQSFLPTVARVAESIIQTRGEIVVSGHTDDVPISNRQFRSNWDLSAARAVSVIHALLENPAVDPRRVVALGHADTRPRSFGAQPGERKYNRRVEIAIELAEPESGEDM